MLKHKFLHHRDCEEEIIIKMEILRSHKSAFERQIHEAVEIQNHKKGIIMDSTTSYSRTSLPRLRVQNGNTSTRCREEREELEEEEEMQRIRRRWKRNCVRGRGKDKKEEEERR